MKKKNWVNGLLLIFSFPAGVVEKFFLKEKELPNSLAPIFIVGAPRTGSTILYQILTNSYDLLYTNNLVDYFYRNFYFGFLLSDLIYGNQPHNTFKAVHGNTEDLIAPSECGSFWYRWLPKGKHYISLEELNPKIIGSIRKNISSTTIRYNKPILFKNLNMGQRLKLVKECYPNAKIIYCRRDLTQVVNSILNAKKKLSMSPTDYWSVMPKNVKDLLNAKSGIEQVTKQVFYIEKQIEEDLLLFKKENKIEINYKNFTSNTEEVLSEVGLFLGDSVIRRKGSFQNIEIYPNENKFNNSKEIIALWSDLKKK